MWLLLFLPLEQSQAHFETVNLIQIRRLISCQAPNFPKISDKRFLTIMENFHGNDDIIEISAPQASKWFPFHFFQWNREGETNRYKTTTTSFDLAAGLPYVPHFGVQYPILPFRTPEKCVPWSTYFVPHLDFSIFPVINWSFNWSKLCFLIEPDIL